MRLLQVCADPGITPDGTKGAAVHLRSLRLALEECGVAVTTLTARAPSVPAAGLLPLPEGGAILAAAAAGERPTAVYERYALGHLGGLDAARALGIPFVLEVNAPLVLETQRWRPARLGDGAEAAELRLFREADLVVAVSEPLRRIVALARGTDSGTLVLRNGCDPALFPEPADSAQDGDPVLVFLGHPKPWHGADAIPDLMRRLEAEGHEARLLLIGGGEGADLVQQRARELRLEDRVEVTGPLPVAEATALLRRGTVAVAPYPLHQLFYFCPIKVIESMAAGLPVVTTAQGDLPEILGEDGILVPPGDPGALAAAVGSLLASPRQRHLLGRRARARALKDFTWRAAAEKLIAALGSCSRMPVR